MTDIALLVRYFEDAETASRDARVESEQARDYYDTKQLTAAQITALKKRRQPIVIENLIRPKIDFLCGLERQTRTDPKALPRTSAHEDDAFAVTDALRYVADDQVFDIKRSAVFANMMVEGFGGVEVTAARVKGGRDPAILHVPWDRLFYDPHSAAPDFSDAGYLGFVTWMDLDEALGETEDGGRWVGKADVLENTESRSSSSGRFDTYDDKPGRSSWFDGRRRRIRINTIYYRQRGTWYRCVYTLAGELEACGPSPWLDEDGKPECGLILASAYVDRDNDRYGLCRDLIPLQDEVNKRRSKFLHHANSRAVRVGTSSIQSAEVIRKEASRPDGVIIADQGDVEFLPNGDLAAGQFQLLQDTRLAIKGAGPNAHLQGKAGDTQSGRAILALQQGGMTELAPLLDNLSHFNLRVYRAVWNRIRQFWNAERWVRVTDDERNVRFVGFNVSKLDLAMSKISDALKAGKIDPDTARAYVLQVQQTPGMAEPTNVIAEMDVDIQIEEVPDSPSLQQAQFDELVKLASLNPEAIPFEDIVRASNLRDKEKILKGIEERNQAAQAPNPAAEAEAAVTGAKAERLKAEAALAGARAHTETVKGAVMDAQAAALLAPPPAAPAALPFGLG